jgi:aconitase B
MEKFKSYCKRAEERFKTQGLLPRPVNADEVAEFIELLQGDNLDETIEFLGKNIKIGGPSVAANTGVETGTSCWICLVYICSREII